MKHSSNKSIRKLLACITLLLVFVYLSGCGLLLLITDGATRLAGDINDGARKLRSSEDTHIEILHKPLARPDGVKGGYEVGLQSSLNRPQGGTLFITDLNSRDTWGTTCHLNYVRVPRELSVSKNAGESVIIILERSPDGQVDVTGLR